MALFKIEALSFKYPGPKYKVLEDINLNIEAGSFVTICGNSGCGKTTLLRHLKPTLTPYGMRKGKIYFKKEALDALDMRQQVQQIGYVFQNPEQQIVTDKVWHELAFGLESLGYDHQTIRLRVAEMASFFGIQNWFHKPVYKLSGGQKQILNLAAIMAMQPEVLILDEPTSQLDPIASKNFLTLLKRINIELGTTIIISEHALEDVLPLSDEMIVMDKGKVIIQDSVSKVGQYLNEINHEVYKALPVAMKVMGKINQYTHQNLSAITVREGRSQLEKFLQQDFKEVLSEELKKQLKADVLHRRLHGVNQNNRAYENSVQNPLVEMKELCFRYERNSEDILKDVSVQIESESIYAIVGGNGTGKSTMLGVLAGIYKPYRGKMKWQKKNIKVAILPQNPSELFHCNTVQEELLEMVQALPPQEKQQRFENSINFFRLNELLHTHPYDLSGGQMQCLALAKILLLQPEVLLLDEPTKGMDAGFKERLGKIFKELKNQGMTLIMVSHDLDFCAHYSDQCALFFDGQIISYGKTKDFFIDNSFYTTAAQRMSRGLLEDCITSEEVNFLCQTHLLGEALEE